jgi:catalase
VGSEIENEAASLVEALYAAFGKHRARAVYAKGVVLTGFFVPAPDAPDLTKAALLASASVPIIARFSSFTGIPDNPDTAAAASPKGLAVRFDLPGSGRLDVVTHSFNGFPTATAAEFGELLRAIAASGSDAARPTALDHFLATHPSARSFLAEQKPAPVGYATLAYYGVNSVMLVNQAGRRVHARFRFVPEAGAHYLGDAALKSKGPDYLGDEMAGWLARGPIVFHWLGQVAGRGDQIDDPSVAWPESRRLAQLGKLTIDRLDPGQAAADRQLGFRPGTMPPGIEPADPMLAVRDATYTFSFNERR